MNRLLAFTWQASSVLAWISLGAMLFGLVVTSAAVIRYLGKHRLELSDTDVPADASLPSEIWRGRDARAGLRIFAAGIALLLIDIALRLSLPSHHF